MAAHYFSNKVLSGPSSLIDKPLFMDKLTSQSRVVLARICVEIKAGQEPHKTIYFIDEYGKEVTQEVRYELQCLSAKRSDTLMRRKQSKTT